MEDAATLALSPAMAAMDEAMEVRRGPSACRPLVGGDKAASADSAVAMEAERLAAIPLFSVLSMPPLDTEGMERKVDSVAS